MRRKVKIHVGPASGLFQEPTVCRGAGALATHLFSPTLSLTRGRGRINFVSSPHQLNSPSRADPDMVKVT